MKFCLAHFSLMLIIDKTLSKQCEWYERKGYYDRFLGRVVYDVYKNTRECIKGYYCCFPGGKSCCEEYVYDDSDVISSDVEDDGSKTMGFIIGITLAVAAVLFMCSMFGRKLCRRGQASGQGSESSGSDPGVVNSSDREQGIVIMQSSPTISSPSSLSDEEESHCSSRKSLLHLHDDTRTFLGLLYARRQYPSEPPPTYSHVMRHKEMYPVKQNMM
ncbi:uncharacterized protein LOC111110621 [Crassostrea virginica]